MTRANLYAVRFERDGESITNWQRVYASDPHAAMIEAGAMLAVQADATAIVRVLA